MSAIPFLKEKIRQSLPQLLAGDADSILTDAFTKCASTDQGSGKIVISLTYADDSKNIPPQERYIDVFILPAGKSLGPHFHKKSSAKIYIVSGIGQTLIGNSLKRFQENTECFFPANTIHDVRANTDTVFISCQDHPIKNDDDSLDFFVPTP